MVKGFLAENWRLKWTCHLSQVLKEFSGKILKNEALQEPLLKDEHKAQRKNSPIRREKSSWTENTMRKRISDEKIFDLDGIYNSQNDRIWTVNREEKKQ